MADRGRRKEARLSNFVFIASNRLKASRFDIAPNSYSCPPLPPFLDQVVLHISPSVYNLGLGNNEGGITSAKIIYRKVPELRERLRPHSTERGTNLLVACAGGLAPWSSHVRQTRTEVPRYQSRVNTRRYKAT